MDDTRENRRAHARANILTAARVCFDQRGPAFTMAEVAGQAQTSLGALYLHFESKDHVVASLLAQDLVGEDPLRVLRRYLAPELVEVLDAHQ